MMMVMIDDATTTIINIIIDRDRARVRFCGRNEDKKDGDDGGDDGEDDYIGGDGDGDVDTDK